VGYLIPAEYHIDSVRSFRSALASAGKRVLHVDAKEYYGANDASLSFQELVAWADQNIQTGSPSERQQFTSVSYTTPPPTSLLQASRQYSLSLSPTLIPSNGSLITSLVRSGVAKYGGYRLLEGVGVYTQPGTFTRVPSSKEDVFKDRNLSLLEKRKLMKFLMFAGSEFEGSAELQGSTPICFSRCIECLKGKHQDTKPNRFCHFFKRRSPYHLKHRPLLHMQLPIVRLPKVLNA
jgi:RAB protein geranylgeranyltransferase component A